MTAMEMNKCPLLFLIPEVWGSNEGNMHSPGGTTMVLHSESLHAVIIDPLWGSTGGNWKSSWKRNPARSASGEPLSCKFLEAGKVL